MNDFTALNDESWASGGPDSLADEDQALEKCYAEAWEIVIKEMPDESEAVQQRLAEEIALDLLGEISA
tara:strand:+ start:1183 stop:1386 length:204 start_codon:yes stop_codon:yes gene_type:complete